MSRDVVELGDISASIRIESGLWSYVIGASVPGAGDRVAVGASVAVGSRVGDSVADGSEVDEGIAVRVGAACGDEHAANARKDKTVRYFIAGILTYPVSESKQMKKSHSLNREWLSVPSLKKVTPSLRVRTFGGRILQLRHSPTRLAMAKH